MKLLASLLASLLFISATAFAVQDSLITEPYKISFDLGCEHSAYTIKIMPPKSTESSKKSTDYNIEITKGSGQAIIRITNYEEAQPILSPEDLAKAMVYSYLSTNTRVLNYTITRIDGTSGPLYAVNYLMSSIIGYKNVYQIEYYPVFDKGHTFCIISSTVPWDAGTRQLIETIHIEQTSDMINRLNAIFQNSSGFMFWPK